MKSQRHSSNLTVKALIPDFGFEAESPYATSNIVTAVCISRVEVLIKFCSKVKTVLLLINQTEGAVKLLANYYLRGFAFEQIGATCMEKFIVGLPRRLTSFKTISSKSVCPAKIIPP